MENRASARVTSLKFSRLLACRIFIFIFPDRLGVPVGLWIRNFIRRIDVI